MFRGAYYGWLIIIGIDGALWVLNPFTRDQHDFLPLSNFLNVRAYDPTKVSDEYTLVYHKDQDGCHLDCGDQDFMAIVIYGEFTRLAY